MENNLKKGENWIKKAYEATPKGEITTKVERVLKACEISKRTFYRWMASGEIPKFRDENTLCEIFNLDPTTKQPLKTLLTPTPQ